MIMKIKIFTFIFYSIFILNVNANEINLKDKFLPLKDFIILKYDLFIQKNLNNIFKGSGVSAVAYQNLRYDININSSNVILISFNATMDKKRYSAKKYYPKLKDCNQIRNKIFTNKYGYSLFSQKLNNLVNDELLFNTISEKILNISTLNDSLKKKIIENTKIKINIFHPNNSKNLSCSGKLIDTELKKLK
tara:strand:+ start:1113 stop:1685 length:573 start_codon:yes stop_codon:yes gene_type:complete